MNSKEGGCMSTMKDTNNLLQGKKRSIREIPATIKAGVRMSRNQLRFCITAVVTLIVALFLVMTIAGNRADNVIAINEEVNVLQDATTAERIEVVDGKFIQFAEGYSRSGNGERTILNEKITTSKQYWVTFGTEEEIAELEKTVGEGRFLLLEKLENNSRQLRRAVL